MSSPKAGPAAETELERARETIDVLAEWDEGTWREKPLSERLAIVSIALLEAYGLKGLKAIKTAEIADLASTTESTMYRYVEDRDQIVRSGIVWCWTMINERISDTEFDDPGVPAPEDIIQRDMSAILQMFADPKTRLAGTGAFLSYRRGAMLTPDGPCRAQRRYEARLSRLCALHMGSQSGAPTDESRQLAVFLTNYLASVWFSWLPYVDRWDHDDFLLNPDYVAAGIRAHLASVATRHIVEA